MSAFKANNPGCCCGLCASLGVTSRTFSGYFLNPPSSPQSFSVHLSWTGPGQWYGTVNTKGAATNCSNIGLGLVAPAHIYVSCVDDVLSVWYRMGICAWIGGCQFALPENPYMGWTGEVTGTVDTVDLGPFLATGTWPAGSWNTAPGCPSPPSPQLTGSWAMT